MSNPDKDRTPYPLPDSPRGYWRTWCGVCGEPIRTHKANVKYAVCDQCHGTNKPLPGEHFRTPRQIEAFIKINQLYGN